LESLGFEVLSPQSQFGDAGLALGQAWVASKILELKNVSTNNKDEIECV
jgi:hypothetical protein